MKLIGIGACTLLPFILAACAGTRHAQAPVPDESRTTEQTMDTLDFGLANDDFWNKPIVRLQPLSELLERPEYLNRIYLAGPNSVVLGQRETAPVVAIRTGTFRQTWAHPYTGQGVLTALDLDSNRLYLASAVPPLDNEIALPPADLDLAPEGLNPQAYVHDLFTVLRLPARPGRFVVRAILNELVSNRISVAFDEAFLSPDPEPARLAAAERASRPPAAVRPEPSVPAVGADGKRNALRASYSPQPGSPPIPEQLGVTLTIDSLAPLRFVDGQPLPWMVHGAFRLAPLAQEWAGPGRLSVNDREAVAVVQISLVIVGTAGEPALVPLSVPAYGASKAAQGNEGTVTGFFSIDLFQFKSVPRQARTCFLYAFAGMTMVGPVQSTLVRTE